MKEFEKYITENEIVRQLYKVRVKIAKSRNKKHLLHLLTTNPKYNYHLGNNSQELNEFEQYQNNIINQLREILPPRKQWAKIGSKSRIKNKNSKELLTTNDKNFYALLKTIKKHKKLNSQENWYLNLTEFTKGIQEKALSSDYEIVSPLIFPKLKDTKKLPPLLNNETNDCRPISMFLLEDRIILSLTNKFLTNAFDKYFKDSSYAFRSKKVDNKIISHHNCIRDILKFKNKINTDYLFVVECDIKKFYDTVNQKIALESFNNFITLVQKENHNLNLEQPKRIFKSYLDSYSFNINVKNTENKEYWSSYKIENGRFPWVNDELDKYYDSNTNERIGVPQGGALSGFIANIYLHLADEKLEKSPVLYQRFCDDMIIIHNDINECEKAKEEYINTLEKLKLFHHTFNENSSLQDISEGKINYKPFWKGKSKGPYKWSNLIEQDSFPWIGFVGYEINYIGEIRVRKKSFMKEFKKQKQIIDEIKRAIYREQRCKKGTAIESAINRLISMSVGRIGLDNFDEVSTDMCWKNGFQELNLNQFSINQLKELDRNRSKLYYKLNDEISDLEDDETKVNSRELINYDKPFSYFYQVIERKEKATANNV